MFDILHNIVKNRWFEIIIRLKNSGEMTVAEISKELNMSYMGIKQQCIELSKLEYLTSHKRKKSTGRPEICYQLSEKILPIFPQMSNPFTMEILKLVDKVGGEIMAHKIIKVYYANKLQEYKKNLHGASLSERIMSVVKMRFHEGYLSYRKKISDDEFSIVEYHNPLQKLHEIYPTAIDLEEQMLADVLDSQVARRVNTSSSPIYAEFLIKAN